MSGWDQRPAVSWLLAPYFSTTCQYHMWGAAPGGAVLSPKIQRGVLDLESLMEMKTLWSLSFFNRVISPPSGDGLHPVSICDFLAFPVKGIITPSPTPILLHQNSQRRAPPALVQVPCPSPSSSPGTLHIIF